MNGDGCDDAPPPDLRPHLAAEIPPALARQARELARRILAAPHPRDLRSEGAAMVLALTEAGLDSYFLHPVEELGVGMVAMSTVKIGLKTAAGGIGLFVRRMVDGMTDDQLRGVAAFVDRMVVEIEVDGPGRPTEPPTGR